jgi:hypothetical protein
MPPTAGPRRRSVSGRQALQRVGLEQKLFRDDLRQDGRGRRNEEGDARSVESDEQPDVPQLHPPRQHKHRDRSDRQAADNVRREHHAAPLEAVAHGPADQQRCNVRHRPGDADEGERARIIGQPVYLPRDRYEIDAVAEEGNLRSRPEQSEVSGAEWPHDAHRRRDAYDRQRARRR